MRPDWTQPRDAAFYQLDLSKNVHYDSLLNETIKNILQEQDVYDYPDELRLYKSICNYYKIDINKTYIGFGASDILDRLFRILDAKKYYIVEPCFELVPPQLDYCNKVYERITVDQLDGLQDKEAVLYVAHPNGNDGSNFCIKDFVQNFKYVVSDEVYSDFDNSTSLLHSKIDNVIVVKSMSKSLGLAGFRVGFCVANDKIINQLQDIRPLYICTKASEIIISNVISMTEEVVARMQLSKSLLAKNFPTVPSSANYILFKEPNVYTNRHGAKQVNNLYRMALADQESLCLL